MQEQEHPLCHMLDDKKRADILGLLTLGSSRRKAAQYVGCAPSTITRAIQRDPDFAARVAKAEQSIETLALANLRAASRNERYWRASAWILEHHNPDDFAKRQPQTIAGDQLAQTLAQLVEILFQNAPHTEWQRTTKLLDDLIEAARHETHDCLSCSAETNTSPAPIRPQNPSNDQSVQHPTNSQSELAATPVSVTHKTETT